MTETEVKLDEPAGQLQESRPAAKRSGLMRLARLCRKELREIVRDRRTIVTLLLMPLLAYPLLSMSFQRLVASSGIEPVSECLVGVVDKSTADRFYHLLNVGQGILRERAERLAAREGAAPPTATIGEDEPTIKVVFHRNLHQAIEQGRIDMAIRAQQITTGQPYPRMVGQPTRFDLIVPEDSPTAKAGAEVIRKRLQAINDFYIAGQMRRLRRSPQLPVDLHSERFVSEQSASSLRAFVPLILILMTITGAVYPAIDLTAGERERGTLETLMAAPVPRFGLLFAKYIAVVTIAMLTAGTNLIAMTVTVMATGMGAVVFGPEGPTLQLIDQVFLLLLLFAAFFSAILLAITSFARSFKEAQSYLIPVMLLTLAPGVMSLMPNMELTPTLAVVPLVNIVLLARDLLAGDVHTPLATAAVLSTLFYAVAAISLAARIFGTDAILYGSEASWSDLARRPAHKLQVPSVSGAMLCLACIYPCYFLLANSLQRLRGATMSTRLLVTGAVTVLLFVGLPIAAAILQNTRIVSTFGLRRSPWLALLGAALLGVSLWPFAHEVFMMNQFLGIEALDASRLESAQALLDSFRAIPAWVILLSLAIAPAVCEEFFFRGYLLSALRPAMPATVALLISSLLFGVFHVITTSVLAPERMLPSTFLGLVLGWVCLRSGSVFPGTLLHALHNGLLLMMGKYRDQLMEFGWGIDEQSHMPATWLASATVCAVIGLALVFVGGAGKQALSQPAK